MIDNGFAKDGEYQLVQAKLVLEALNAFMVFADDHVTINHCPEYRQDQKKGR